MLRRSRWNGSVRRVRSESAYGRLFGPREEAVKLKPGKVRSACMARRLGTCSVFTRKKSMWECRPGLRAADSAVLGRSIRLT